MQVLATHGVIGAGHLQARGSALDEHAPNALAPRLSIDTGEHDEHPGLLGAADQCFDAVDDHPVVLDHGIRAIVGYIGAGMRFRHADRKDAIASDHGRQNPGPNRLWGIFGDHTGLYAGLPQDGHRGRVADLGDLLENQRRLENR
jgi:hypothetical protein